LRRVLYSLVSEIANQDRQVVEPSEWVYGIDCANPRKSFIRICGSFHEQTLLITNSTFCYNNASKRNIAFRFDFLPQPLWNRTDPNPQDRQLCLFYEVCQ
jgi:hypothetical protein